MVVIVVMIVIAVPAMAPCPHVFQIPTAVLRLTAVFTVLPFRIVQLALGIADLLFAPSVIIMIAIQRPRGNRSAQERQNHKRGNECLGSLEHASSSDCLYILLLDAPPSHAAHLKEA
jgi:hypothetical protein